MSDQLLRPHEDLGLRSPASLVPSVEAVGIAPSVVVSALVRPADAVAIPPSSVVPSRWPRWITILDEVHIGSRSPVAAAVDAGVLALAGVLAALPWHLALLAPGLLVLAFHVGQSYRRRGPLETQGVLWYPPRIATAYTTVTLALVAGSRRLGADHFVMARFALLGALGLLGLRSLTWLILSARRRAGDGQRATLVVGAGPAVRTVSRKLRDYPEAGLQPVGIVSMDPRRASGDGVGWGRALSDLPEIITGSGVRHIVLVPEGNQDSAIAECLGLCDGIDVSFSLLPPLAEFFLHPSLVTQVGGVPLIAVSKASRTRSQLPGKRAFDIVVTSLMLVLSAPVLLGAACAVKLADRGPVLFRQPRVGHGGRVFQMLKLRSMVVGAERHLIDLRDRNVTDGLLFKVTDDPRVTRIGRILRRLSIDELPQLWNVFRGEMSLVGPRPLAVEPDDFGSLDGKRHSVPPGITGYWQLAGGNGLTYEEMVKLDLAYIENWSLWVDMRLLLRTVPALFTRHRHGPC
jgi:exopolysaccharide biosynthesis polyprenyl glycosylphosphotransferase